VKGVLLHSELSYIPVKTVLMAVCLTIFTATRFYEVFSGKQPCQDIKILQRFGD
jgi:hypothetical protein